MDRFCARVRGTRTKCYLSTVLLGLPQCVTSRKCIAGTDWSRSVVLLFCLGNWDRDCRSVVSWMVTCFPMSTRILVIVEMIRLVFFLYLRNVNFNFGVLYIEVVWIEFDWCFVPYYRECWYCLWCLLIIC